jgi:hypothetical protein
MGPMALRFLYLRPLLQPLVELILPSFILPFAEDGAVMASSTPLLRRFTVFYEVHSDLTRSAAQC